VLQGRAASHPSGVDLGTGKGLAEGLKGASVAVDVTNSPPFEDAEVMKFFKTATVHMACVPQNPPSTPKTATSPINRTGPGGTSLIRNSYSLSGARSLLAEAANTGGTLDLRDPSHHGDCGRPTAESRPIRLTEVPTVDEILRRHESALGRDFVAYRNHVHRVVNLSLSILGRCRVDHDKLAVAAAFHDLGIWTHHTFDYLQPSVELARGYLMNRARTDWIPEIEAMIVNHHKITAAQSRSGSLVEAFRRADWIDVSRGLRRFAVPRPFIALVFATWPSAGFHWRLVELTLDRLRHHPLTPLPMVRL
jgi:hypothetical protein